MNRFLLALGAAALCALAQPASAQAADALGMAVPAADAATGTLIVRVVDGAPSKPVVGIDVELIVPSGGSARAARTDAEGRATFTKLPVGDRYVARVTTTVPAAAAASGGPEQKIINSEPFDVPSQNGLRLLLSVSAWQGGAAAGAEDIPGNAGFGGMAGTFNPRDMSGIGRPQPGDPRGQLTVRVVRGQMSNNVADQPVHLVGYAADGSITRITRRTDVAGRVVFDGLVSDRVAYYAMTDLPRMVGDRTVSDRVRSGAIMMPPEVGQRLLLAGLAPDTGAAPVEDLERVETQEASLGPGEVLVRLFGKPETTSEVELVRIDESGITSVARAPLSLGRPGNVRGLVSDQILPQGGPGGTIVVAIQRITASAARPLAGMELAVEPVGSPPAGEPVRQISDGQGRAVFPGLTPGTQVRVVARVHGVRFEGEPFTVSATEGQGVGVNVAFDEGGAEARFRDVPANSDAVYVARATANRTTYHTAPFQMAADRGATLRMLVLAGISPVLFSFHTQGFADDVYMGFQNQFTINNYSYAPWDAGREGFVMPLPAGFVGAQVDESMTHRVAVDPDRGFLWRGSIPPGGAEFIGYFSLPIADGTMTFDLPLPHGAYNSLLMLSQTPGMKVNLPPDVRGREWSDPDGRKYYVVTNIQIDPNQRMVLTTTGLPQAPVWQRYVTWGVGILVVGLLVWGLSGVFWRRKGEAVQVDEDAREEQSRRRKLERRREHLLDELVMLEAEKAGLDGDEYEKRKSKLTRQLESIYHDLAADRAGARPRA